MAVVPIASLVPILPPQAATRARHDGIKRLCQCPARATGLQGTKLRVQSFVSPQSHYLQGSFC